MAEGYPSKWAAAGQGLLQGMQAGVMMDTNIRAGNQQTLENKRYDVALKTAADKQQWDRDMQLMGEVSKLKTPEQQMNLVKAYLARQPDSQFAKTLVEVFSNPNSAAKAKELQNAVNNGDVIKAHQLGAELGLPEAGIKGVLDAATAQKEQTNLTGGLFLQQAIPQIQGSPDIQNQMQNNRVELLAGAGKTGQEILKEELKPEKTPTAEFYKEQARQLEVKLKLNPSSVTEEEKTWLSAQKEQTIASAKERTKGMIAARGMTMNDVIDPKTGNSIKVSTAEILKQPMGTYGNAGDGIKATMLDAVHNEIEASLHNLDAAIEKIDFSQGQIAKFARLQARNDDGSFIRNYLDSNLGKTLTTDEINYLNAIANTKESLYSLRGISGQGTQGSDKLRNAMDAMIPGSTTPNKESAREKLKLVWMQQQKLREGIVYSGNQPQNRTPLRRATDKGSGTVEQTNKRIPTIKSDAQFNALSSGTEFFAPDGTKRRKP